MSDDFLKYSIKIEKKFENIEINTFRGSLSNVIMVILENAIYELKSLNKIKIIKIHTKTINDLVFIEIEDSGRGIACVETIFNSNYTTKLHQGTGIGLSCKSTYRKKTGRKNYCRE